MVSVVGPQSVFPMLMFGEKVWLAVCYRPVGPKVWLASRGTEHAGIRWNREGCILPHSRVCLDDEFVGQTHQRRTLLHQVPLRRFGRFVRSHWSSKSSELTQTYSPDPYSRLWMMVTQGDPWA